MAVRAARGAVNQIASLGDRRRVGAAVKRRHRRREGALPAELYHGDEDRGEKYDEREKPFQDSHDKTLLDQVAPGSWDLADDS